MFCLNFIGSIFFPFAGFKLNSQLFHDQTDKTLLHIASLSPQVEKLMDTGLNEKKYYCDTTDV